MALTIRTEIETDPQRPPAVRVFLTGSLDTATSPDLETELNRLMKESPRILVFNLKELKFISSAGIRILAKARKLMQEKGGTCVLMHPQPQIEKVLEIIKALPGLSIFRNEAEMDAYLTGVQNKVLRGDIQP